MSFSESGILCERSQSKAPDLQAEQLRRAPIISAVLQHTFSVRHADQG